MKNYSNIISKKGFTLIELLVSIAIIVMLIIVFLPLYRRYNLRNDVINTVQFVNEKVLYTQSLAHSSQNKGASPKYTYYRFLFDPVKVPMRWEIRVGNFDLSKLDVNGVAPKSPTAEEWLGVTDTRVETGYLTDGVSFVNGPGLTHTITGFWNNQASIIFQIAGDKCYFTWEKLDPADITPDPGPIRTFTFRNSANYRVYLDLNLRTCKTNVRYNIE